MILCSLTSFRIGSQQSRAVPPQPALERSSSDNRFLSAENLHMMALCEVANVPGIKKSSYCHVVADESAVVTRFFFVFCKDNQRPATTLDSTKEPLKSAINACMDSVLQQQGRGDSNPQDVVLR